MSEERSIIFVSLEPWDEVWRRNQFVCAELARRGWRVLFVEPPRDVSRALRRGELGALRGGTAHDTDTDTDAGPGLERITRTRPVKLLPESWAIGRVVNAWLARRHVARAARRLGLRTPMLWLNAHHAVHMAGRLGAVATIYDITDDWTQCTQSEAVRQRTAAQDATLCRRADAVIVCSQGLYESKRPLAASLHLIPNGVDCEHYRAVLDATGPLPEAAQHWRGPVLGYTGTLHADRLDVTLVASVARAMPDVTLVLLGPNCLGPNDRQVLERVGVVMPGAVPYAELPQYMRAFDACIVPHRVTAFTESLNPIKLWEYLAAGKPIVATPVAGFRDYPQHVHLAEDEPGFVAAVRAALDEPAAARAARRAEARRHGWASRVDAIEAVMAAAAGGGVSERASGEVAHA